ncbi:MAG TPA: hypothetical protein VEK73_07805 [Xanthobacteraceae bacterium]|nr:hypothetical protein [Xanthobacteraceae bacterium]
MDRSEYLTEEALSLGPLLILYSMHHSLAKRGLITIEETERTLNDSVRIISDPAKENSPWHDDTNRGICHILGLFVHMLRTAPAPDDPDSPTVAGWLKVIEGGKR